MVRSARPVVPNGRPVVPNGRPDTYRVLHGQAERVAAGEPGGRLAAQPPLALIWARVDDGARKARRVITLGTPFHGTTLAAAAAAFVPRLCPVACRQLVPGSSLLARLNATPLAAGPAWLSLWTTDDLVVTPPDSARLAGALDVPVQAVCPGRQISHQQPPADPVVAAMVLRAIGREPMRYPTAATCRG